MSEWFEIIMAILFAIALYVAIACVNCFHTVRKGNARIKKGTIKKFIDDYWFEGFYDDLVRANIMFCSFNLINLIYVLCTNSESVDQSSDLFYNVDINHEIDWSVFMDSVIICELIVLVVGFLVDIIRSIKADRGLGKDHDRITETVKENGTSLSQDVKDSRDLITQDVKENRQLIGKQLEKTFEIEKLVTNEIKMRENQNNSLSQKQLEAKTVVEAYNYLLNEVKRLQVELLELTQENQELKQQLQEYEQTEQLTPDEPDFSQPDMKFE